MLSRNGGLSAMRRNLILASLPEEELKTLSPHLQEIDLPFGKVMFSPNQVLSHAYFITSGVASLMVTLSNGDSVEVASVGREALIGAGGLLRVPYEPLTTMIQAEGSAYSIPIHTLQRSFNDSAYLRGAILRNLYVQTSQMAQTAACNRVHEVEQRLARWMLILQDLIGGDHVVITHEILATMLGTRRTTVTLAAGLLQGQGAIEYKRGKIVILDRRKLEAASCECYATLRDFVRTIPFAHPRARKNRAPGLKP